MPSIEAVKNPVNETRLRALALVSALYDLALGIPMLVAAPQVARLMGAGAPSPVINAQLNGLFTITLAIGYFWAAADVEARRGYLWVAGVFAKAAGALLFVVDHFARGSPDSFLLFAVTDGSLALVTLVLLMQAKERDQYSSNSTRG
jgi:hypothetical protein